MTAIPQSENGLTLPRSIRSLLRQIALRQWWVGALVGLLQTLTLALLALLAGALVLGFEPKLWMPARILVAAIVWAAGLRSLIFLVQPVLRIPSLAGAARHAESRFPHLQERLSSTVELIRETDPTFAGSHALIQHLMLQAQSDAASLRAAQVVGTERLFRWTVYFTPVLLAWVILALLPLTGTRTLAGAYRVIFPWRSELPSALSIVRVQPGDATLAQGDALEITAQISGSSPPSHASLLRRFADGRQATDQMESPAPGSYRLQFDAARDGFSYKVTTDAADSPWFAATVHPVPSITGLSVHYDFPRYTGIPSKTVPLSDGTIDAVVGTRITLTIHSSSPATAAASHVHIEQEKELAIEVPLRALSEPNTYGSQFTVRTSGRYTIRLVNEYGLTNRGEHPRTIIARPDEPPTISIQSPPPETSVRTDDVVPIRFTASDDFGLARIDAQVQVDDKPAQSSEVRFQSDDGRHTTGPDYPLSIQDVLDAAGASDAKRIIVHLQATDNRDPDPQFSLSNQVILNINRGQWQSTQGELEERQERQLEDAMRKAMNDLDRNKSRLEQARSPNVREDPAEQQEMERKHRLNASRPQSRTDEARQASDQAHAAQPRVSEPLEEWQKKGLDQAANELPQTSKDLSKSADGAADSVFVRTAAQVKEIADGPIRDAADEATRADLNPDDATDRTRSAIRAVHHITAARDALQKLLEQREMDRTHHDAEAARNLADAARDQQQAAELMQSRQAAERDDQSRARQRRAMEKQQLAGQRLQQAIGQSEPLRDPHARETGQHLEELIRRVEEVSRQQTAEQQREQKTNRPPDHVTQEQDRIAQRSDEARQQSRNLQQKAHDSKDPDIQQRAKLAEKDLGDATEHARTAARLASDKDKTDQGQHETAEALARAEADLRGNAQQENASGPPVDLKQRAGQRAQEAAEAQQEALQQNPDAAAQAARATGQAAQAMAQAVPGALASDSDPFQQANQQQANGRESSAQPGQSDDSQKGISQRSALFGPLPAAIRDLGLSADEWAKLPPLAKKDLLNAARQTGPPAYRQMIKDYYSRLAEMRNE